MIILRFVERLRIGVDAGANCRNIATFSNFSGLDGALDKLFGANVHANNFN